MHVIGKSVAAFLTAFLTALCATCGLALAGGDTLRIGALVPATGPAALIGQSLDQGFRLLYEDAEKNGLAGRKVKFTIYDTEAKPQNAVQLFNRLIDNDEVDVVVGPLTSGEGLAISPIANQRKVPILAIGAAQALTTPVTPYMFAMAPVDSVVTADALRFLAARKMKRVGLIYSTDGMGQSGGKMLESIAAQHGIELVDVETFAPQDTDMTPQLLNLRNKNPDAIIMWTAVNPASTIILKAAKSLGIKSQWVLSYGQAYNSFRDQAGEVANGAFVVAYPIFNMDGLPASDPRKKILADFTKMFQARWGVPPDQSAGHALDTKLVLEEAVKKIKGPITRENLRDAIETVHICGNNGCRQFSATDHRANDKDAIMMLKIQDGKWLPTDK